MVSWFVSPSSQYELGPEGERGGTLPVGREIGGPPGAGRDIGGPPDAGRDIGVVLVDATHARLKIEKKSSTVATPGLVLIKSK